MYLILHKPVHYFSHLAYQFSFAVMNQHDFHLYRYLLKSK